MAFKMKGFKPHNMYKTERANTHKEHLDLKQKGYDHSPYRKDKLVTTDKHGGGVARVKPVKHHGDGVSSFTVKNPDKSTVTFRSRNTDFEDANYNPKPLKPKKTKKLKTKRVPRKLKNVKAPEYNVKVNLDEKTQKIADARGKNPKKKKNLVSKIFTKKNKTSRPKARRVKNLVTGKTNIIS
jgi:hypothetical protein|tara:strand:- start:383 stop:928 length:546 start_codon:yes stop_codon:yes gene_type:complete